MSPAGSLEHHAKVDESNFYDTQLLSATQLSSLLGVVNTAVPIDRYLRADDPDDSKRPDDATLVDPKYSQERILAGSCLERAPGLQGFAGLHKQAPVRSEQRSPNLETAKLTM